MRFNTFKNVVVAGVLALSFGAWTTAHAAAKKTPPKKSAAKAGTTAAKPSPAKKTATKSKVAKAPVSMKKGAAKAVAKSPVGKKNLALKPASKVRRPATVAGKPVAKSNAVKAPVAAAAKASKPSGPVPPSAAVGVPLPSFPVAKGADDEALPIAPQVFDGLNGVVQEAFAPTPGERSQVQAKLASMKYTPATDIPSSPKEAASGKPKPGPRKPSAAGPATKVAPTAQPQRK